MESQACFAIVFELSLFLKLVQSAPCSAATSWSLVSSGKGGTGGAASPPPGRSAVELMTDGVDPDLLRFLLPL